LWILKKFKRKKRFR